MVDKVIVANSDAIKRLDREIRNMTKAKTDDTKKTDVEDEGDVVNKKKAKKCRYYDRGYCKYNDKCRFGHPQGVCDGYLKD